MNLQNHRYLSKFGAVADYLSVSKEINKIIPFLSLEHGPWVAGGFVRKLISGTPLSEIIQKDIDVFCPNKKVADYVVSYLKRRTGMQAPSFETEYSEMYDVGHYHINIITKKTYPTALELLDSFDFTACRFVMDNDHIYYTSQNDIDDAKNLILRPQRTTQLYRIAKYLNYGFKPVSMGGGAGDLDAMRIVAILDPDKPYFGVENDEMLACIGEDIIPFADFLTEISRIVGEVPKSQQKTPKNDKANRTVGRQFPSKKSVEDKSDHILWSINDFLGDEFVKISLQAESHSQEM